MADLEIKCTVCARTMTVSEFVDPDAIFCHSCGEQLQIPQKAQDKKTPSVKVAHGKPLGLVPPKKELTENEQAAEEPPKEWRFHTATKKDPSKDKKLRLSPALISTTIFIILGSLCFYMRYRLNLPPEQVFLLKRYSPIIYAAFHILIALKAFGDSVFHGVLCILLPPYALYYLFLVSDDFYMRGVFGGILFAVGEDSFYIFQGWIMDFVRVANDFIQGGALR